MERLGPTIVLALIGVLVDTATAFAVDPAQEPKIDFARQIRPILASRCFKCHGLDEKNRQADLRLDVRESAVASAITPGRPDRSELVARVMSSKDDQRMPPPKSNLTLTAEEISLLKEWVAEGADYAVHWSFVKPRRPPLPAVKNRAWARNEIDRFILARLEGTADGTRSVPATLSPSPPADRATLLRRLSFDLTGVPPTLAELDDFLNDKSETAYERAVDRLLASPLYGERMAQDWLDLARFGDTNGYHYDSDRQMWLYRDWVIRAFNANQPYDRFVVEQLAGDLLPRPTLDQRIATGFSRNCTFNEEGGADPDEYLVTYAVDRVATTGAVFLGLTLGCAQCHDHKHDPISQREFYQLIAFFNNVAGEKGAQGHDLPLPPLLSTPNREQAQDLALLDKQRETIEEKVQEQLAKVRLPDEGTKGEPAPSGITEIVWIEDGLPAGAEPQGDEGEASWTWVTGPEHPVFSGKKATWRKSVELSQHFFTDAKPEIKLGAGDTLFAYVYLDPADPPKAIMLQFNDGLWDHRAYWGENLFPFGTDGTANRFPAGKLPPTGEWTRLEVSAASVGLPVGSMLNGWAFTQVGGSVYWDKAGVVSTGTTSLTHFDTQTEWEKFERTSKESKLPKEILPLVKLDAAKRTAGQRQTLQDYYLRYACTHTRELFAPSVKELAALDARREALVKTIPTTMVMIEATQRAPTHVLIRGDFEQRGEQVEPDVPSVFPPLPKDAPRNRLALANWLVDADNPLTARVAVNRQWKTFFGAGLVQTPDDFGAQGEFPSHPELLDWLAVEFQESGWNVKALQKKLVMSAAYRQSSASVNAVRRTDNPVRQGLPSTGKDVKTDKIVHPTIETHPGVELDPENRLLWRQNRFRRTAESLRDSALAASGLLSRRLGGPSVFPYQPPNYFGDKGRWTWAQSSGEDLYRRGLYTFWRRTTFYPSFQIFDAPSREACTVERSLTNTPLQALVTLNDPTYVEAARVLAQRVTTLGGPKLDDRLSFVFRTVVSRPPTPRERTLLSQLYAKQLARFQANPKAAQALATAGESPPLARFDAAELAAWTAISNVILNLDEALTRE